MSRSSWFVRIVSCSLIMLGSVIPAMAAKPSADYPPVTKPITSFGAAALDGFVYVYGGHTGQAHRYSKQDVSPRFERLPISGGKNWETLVGGPGLQSVALVTHGGALYRVGGLSALNEVGEEAELVSVTDFYRYDTAKKVWTALKPLPEGRSSHDAIVSDGVLYVVGGWNLGKDKKWYDTSMSIKLDDPAADWVALPKQNFQKRAIAVAAHRGRIYAIGGMKSDNQTTTEVAYFDVAKQVWVNGPSLPGNPMDGFGSAAVVAQDRLYATTMDGQLHRLSDDNSTWEAVGKLAQPRFFHRLVGTPDGILVIGGANMSTGHIDSVELVTPATSAIAPTAGQ